jgi:hypothetical protein
MSVCFFDSPQGLTQSRLKAREIGDYPRFVLSREFETYQFRYDSGPDVDLLLRQRWQKLRSRYRYLRLWFSGGKDSRVALDSAIKHNIYIDEIFVMMYHGLDTKDPFLTGEVTRCGLAYLDSVKTQLKVGRINVVDLYSDHYLQVYQDPDWIYQVRLYEYMCINTPNIFHRYINSRWGFTDDGAGCADIVGMVFPSIWYDPQGRTWKFTFVDMALDTQVGCRAVNFAIDFEDPRLFEAILSQYITGCINNGHWPGRFQLPITPHQGDHRKLCSLYDFLVHNHEWQFPKTVLGAEFRPGDHSLWLHNSNAHKAHLNAFQCWYTTPWPSSFKAYVENTDWSKIDADIAKGGVPSQDFVVHYSPVPD